MSYIRNLKNLSRTIFATSRTSARMDFRKSAELFKMAAPEVTCACFFNLSGDLICYRLPALYYVLSDHTTVVLYDQKVLYIFYYWLAICMEWKRLLGRSKRIEVCSSEKKVKNCSKMKFSPVRCREGGKCRPLPPSPHQQIFRPSKRS